MSALRLVAAMLLLGVSACERAERRPVVRTETGEMVLVPEGWFLRGSESGEPDERPMRRVWLDAFLIDRCEVTQEQFARLAAGRDHSHFKGARHPVQNLTWPAVVRWCNARSRAEGLAPCYDEQTGECDHGANGYRLPTEAEWEYACRAGGEGEWCYGDDPRRLGDHAWFRSNAGSRAHPVGELKPNAWGIHDMHGNVVEWCNDSYSADYYARSPERNPHGPPDSDRSRPVVRGGAWDSSAEACRSAARRDEYPGEPDGCFSRGDIGFRCVRRAGEG